MQSIILQLTAADVTRRDVRALPDDDGHMFRSGIISRGVSLAVMLVPWNPIKWGGGGGGCQSLIFTQGTWVNDSLV
jgi:hypothetical protein